MRQPFSILIVSICLFGRLVPAEVAQTPIRVACVGDSITFGYGVRNHQDTYPERLARWLGSGYDVRNFGVSATTLITRGDFPYVRQPAYAKALEFKPDILIIMLGTNDTKHPGDGSLQSERALNNWRLKGDFVHDYEALIVSFRSTNPAMKVYVCSPVPAFPGRWGINDKTIRDEVTPFVRQVAKESDATVIDLYSALQGRGELFPDSIHPNDGGDRFIAAGVYSALTGRDPPAAPDTDARMFLNHRVLWLGDSVTQDGQYVSDVEYYLNRDFPDAKIDIISIGLASETVSGLTEKEHPFPRPDLHERLKRALDLVKPVVVVACYGMNDGIYHPLSPERAKVFHDGIETTIKTIQTAGAETILLTPPPFDPLPVGDHVRKADAADFSYRNPFEQYDSVLKGYSKWEMKLPLAEVPIVVDLHFSMKYFIDQKRQNDSRFGFTTDGIHPSAAGHLFMARAILDAIGAKYDAGDLDAYVAKLKNDALFQLVERQRKIRSDGWLPYVGYTRGETVKTDNIADTERKDADLQAQIDAIRKAGT